MISEAAVTGKPIYIAMMKSKRLNKKFRTFYSQFNNLGMTKETLVKTFIIGVTIS